MSVQNAVASSRNVVVIRSGETVATPSSKRVSYPDEVLFAPLTRVEFAALEARGGDARDWVRNLPVDQRQRPAGIVSGAKRRFRLSSTVTVVEG